MKRVIVAASPFALPRPGNIQDTNLLVVDEIDNCCCRLLNRHFRCVNKLVRTLKLLAAVECEFRSTLQLRQVKNHRSIGFSHVRKGSLRKTAVFQFCDRIPIRNLTEFIQPPGRTPAAAFNPMFQREIERCTINTSLSARNNFHLQL